VFTFTPEDEIFRRELSAWLDENLVGEFADHRGIGSPTDETAWDVRRRWERKLAADRWLGISWPREYGGRGGTLTQELVFEIEYAAHAAPARVNFQGTDLFGPTLLRFGAEALKHRFLPAIAASEEIWGQGFSEPGAGSDLAAISTRARLDGDSWEITGQKIWTTFGHRAEWLYVLARTEQGSERHHGLSMLLIRADAPGVEIRTIRNVAGDGEFSEVFLDAARTPADLVVGEVGGGWKVAMGLLGVERGKTLVPLQMALRREVEGAVESYRERGVTDPTLRDQLVRSAIDVQVLQALVGLVLAPVLAGGEPGPTTSVTKLFASETHQRLAATAFALEGMATLGSDRALSHDVVRRTMFLSLAETIYGGTSQIQRNLIAERVLGLPR